jgi:hypothetical protein
MPTNISPYSLHPSYAHWSAMIASLEERTGKNMAQWLAALKKAKLPPQLIAAPF